MITIHPENSTNDTGWITSVLNRCTELMGPAGSHPYYDLLFVDFIENGIEPDRGTWRSRFIPHRKTNNMMLEIEIDDTSLYAWLKLEFDNMEINGSILKVVC